MTCIDCPYCKGTGEMIHIRLEHLENCDYCDGKGQVPDTPKVRKQIAKGDFNNVPSYYDSAETHPDYTYKRTEESK